MDMLRRIRTPALVMLLLVAVSAGSIYFASQLPAYNPYQLDERFTSLDPNVWEIGGMKNYSVSNGVLTMFDSTNATHYFVTNPKWRPNVLETWWTRLQGSLEISFNAYAPTNHSLAVASTDSWRALLYNGMLELDLNGTAGGKGVRVEVVLDSGWHSLAAESSAGSLEMSLDGHTLARVDDWNGNLTRVELGTGLQSMDGLSVKGVLAVNGVKADLQPLVESQTLSPENPTSLTELATKTLLSGHPHTASHISWEGDSGFSPRTSSSKVRPVKPGSSGQPIP